MRIFMRLLVIVLVLGVGTYLLRGNWNGFPWADGPRPGSAVTGDVGLQKARERGAELGEKAAVATQNVKETVHDAAITTKIRAKLALDDTVKARAVDVSTNGSTVTLRGTIGGRMERDRVVALARETAGVTVVVDRIAIDR